MNNGQVISNTTGKAASQIDYYFKVLLLNMRTYWQYWIIGALVFYILLFCGCKRKEGFFNISWDELAPSFQSFGRTPVLAKLNDAVWKGAGNDCYPNGEFYVMRYSEPKTCYYGLKAQKPIKKGYYNVCGKKIS